MLEQDNNPRKRNVEEDSKIHRERGM